MFIQLWTETKENGSKRKVFLMLRTSAEKKTNNTEKE